MRDLLETLFPYIVILYLLDGIKHVNPYHLLFTSFYGEKFNLIKSGTYFINISPLGQTIFAYKLPVCFTNQGLYSVSMQYQFEDTLYQAEDFQFLAYDNMTNIEADGKKVEINNHSILKTPSTYSANHIANFIQELKNTHLEKRQTKIQAFLTASTNIEQIKSLTESTPNAFFNLKALCLFLFIQTFIILPTTLYSEWLVYFNFSMLLLTMTIVYLLILIITSYIYKKNYKASIGHIIIEILSIVFSPPAAIQSARHLTQDMYVNFNPLAIAAVLSPNNIFKDIMRRELYALDHIKNLYKDEGWLQFWNFKKELHHKLLNTLNIPLSEIWVTPLPEDVFSISYCPICLAEYRADFTKCSDCGILLKPFIKA